MDEWNNERVADIKMGRVRDMEERKSKQMGDAFLYLRK